MELNWLLYLPDLLALAFFFAAWATYSFIASRYKKATKPSLLIAMHALRVEWLTQMQMRELQIPDMSLLTLATYSCTFLASTSILIIAGLIASLAAPDRVMTLVAMLPLSGGYASQLTTYKVLALIGLFIYTFFIFTWTIRQNAYCGVVACSLPQMPASDIEKARRNAKNLAGLFTLAGSNFNYGLRAYYFSLAMLTWFISPYLFILSTLLVVIILWQREFRSKTLKAIMRAEDLLCRESC